VSKLDESACFGGILEPILKHRWPLWYCTTGQNIPQDIEIADSRKLVKRLMAGLQSEKAALATAS
jgi:flagellar biosynthesis protein FlhF